MYNDELQGLSLIKQANIHVLYTARAEKNSPARDFSYDLRDKLPRGMGKKNLALSSEFLDKAGEKFFHRRRKESDRGGETVV
jgi:hypothetical protein